MKIIVALILGMTIAVASAEEWVGIHTYAAYIAAAHAHTRLGETIEALRWLDATPTQERRGWEWRWLRTQLDRTSVEWPSASAPITAMANSGDGAVVAIGLRSGRVEFRAANDGALIASLDVHTAPVRSVALSADGDLLASGGEDRFIRVTRISTGEKVVEWENPDFSVRGVAFSPDGKKVAFSTFLRDRDRPPGIGVVKILDLGHTVETVVLLGNAHPIDQVVFSPSGTQVWGATWDKAVFAWSLATGQRTTVFVDHTQHVRAVAVSELANRVVSGGDDQRINLRTLSDGVVVRTIDQHQGDVTAVAFSPDRSIVASSSKDGSIRLWRSQDGQAIATMTGHRAGVMAFVFRLSDQSIIAGGADGSLRVFQLNANLVPRWDETVCAAAYSAVFSPTSDRLGVVCYDGTVNVVSLEDWKIRSTLRDNISRNAADWTHDGRALVVGTNTGCVEYVGRISGTCLPIHQAPVVAIATLADGRVVSASHDQSIKISQDGVVLATLEGHTAALIDTRVDSKDRFAVSTSRDGTIRIWDLEDASLLRVIGGEGHGPLSADFLADGGVVASFRDGVVRAWDVRGEASWQARIAAEDLYRIRVCPDGLRIAVGSSSALHVLDAHTGTPLLRLNPHNDTIWSLGWSNDGKSLASASWNGTVAVLSGD